MSRNDRSHVALASCPVRTVLRVGQFLSTGGGALCPSRWQHGLHPSRHGRLPLRSRRPACAAQPTARDGCAATGGPESYPVGSSLGLDRRTPGHRHQVRFASLRDGCATLDPDVPVLRDGLYEGAGKVQVPAEGPATRAHAAHGQYADKPRRPGRSGGTYPQVRAQISFGSCSSLRRQSSTFESVAIGLPPEVGES